MCFLLKIIRNRLGAKQVINLYKLCKQNKYDVVHTHYYFANSLFLGAAKLAGIKKRVSHCHNTRTITNIPLRRKVFELVARKLLLAIGTDFLGCSNAATKFLYGEEAFRTGQALTLYNGIDFNYWDINTTEHHKIRNKYNIGQGPVVLFVGRLEMQKNPLYALDVINEIRKRLNNLNGLIVGDGSIKKDILDFIATNSMGDFVQVLPSNSNIKELQSISNVMIAPSLWEGLPIAFIEAQKMETMVFTSNNVPDEVGVGLCKFLDLKEKEVWVEAITSYLNNKETKVDIRANLEKFNVLETTNNLIAIYNK